MREKDKEKESGGKLVRTRTGLLIGIFIAILGAFTVVLYDLQYVHGQEYLSSASYSVPRTESVSAARGEITDCYGRVLVTNGTVYQVTLDTSLMGTEQERYETLAALLELCREEGVEWSDSLPVTASPPYAYTLSSAASGEVTRLRKLTERLDWGKWSSVTVPGGVDPDTGEQLDPVEQWTPALTAEQLIAAMREQYKLDERLPGLTDGEARALVGVLYELDLRKREITYTEYVFATDVDIAFITRVREGRLNGVVIEAVAVRQYQTSAAAHILGRISAVTAEQWEGDEDTVGYRDREGYSYNDQVGQDGVERAFEEYLHGVSGTLSLETDSTGKVVNESWETEPQPGSNVSLTLDVRLQTAVEQILTSHIEGLEESAGGAAVAVDMTGGVLAMVSYPTYDLSAYSQNFTALLSDPLKPMFNRATQGTYMPGSIFKMVTALAGLEEGVIEPTTRIRDTGYFLGYTSNVEYAPKCWIYRQYGGATHGLQTVDQAIRNSCNVFFYEVGYRLGIETLGSYASMVGLGQPTGIEIPERTGYVAGPETSALLGVDWYAGATTAASIGQENNLFTPLQLANYIATLVNGGTRYEVHLLKSVKSADYSEVLYEHEPVILDQIDIGPENLEVIKEGMYQVTQTNTVAPYFNALPFKAGAKTGTAQVDNNTSTNATFVCFAPYDDPQIALCLVVEKGMAGSGLAQMAAEILQFYFSTEDDISVVSGENSLLR